MTFPNISIFVAEFQLILDQNFAKVYFYILSWLPKGTIINSVLKIHYEFFNYIRYSNNIG